MDPLAPESLDLSPIPDTLEIQQFSTNEYMQFFQNSIPSHLKPSISTFLSSETARPAHLTSLQERYQAFVKDEVAISGMDSRYLVRPSGSIESKLGVKLHYPSFTTTNTINGEVADIGNSCVRLWILKGLDEHSCLMYEEYYRRQEPPKNRKSPMREWTEQHRKVHEGFNQWLDESSHQKVVLLSGVHVQDCEKLPS
jgi:hypothetical protein